LTASRYQCYNPIQHAVSYVHVLFFTLQDD
jgi:hypothetical protein